MSHRTLTLAKLVAIAVHQGDLDEVRRLMAKAVDPLPPVTFDPKKGITFGGPSV
jgi:hypothetical protein